MSSLLSSSYDLRITVKLTKRIPINPREDLLNHNLRDIYHQCLQILSGKNYTEKRVSSKLQSSKGGLILTKGSWWPNGPNVATLPYTNILKFCPYPERPAKVIMLVANVDRTKLELVVVKTKGLAYANLLLSVLQKYVKDGNQGSAENASSVLKPGSRPISYQRKAINTGPSMPKHSINSASAHPAEELSKSHKLHENTAARGLPPEPRMRPMRVKKAKEQIYEMDSDRLGPTNGEYQENYSRTSYDPETKIETLDSVINYDHQFEKPIKSTSSTKSRKTRYRAPRELSALSGGRKVSRELDENNTPWEVNISYIKYDPLVGCVEDESGPIYMYSAHQLVPREDPNYDGYNSDDVEGDYSSDGNSDDYSSSESGSGPDENKELERYMMLSRNNFAKNGIKGTEGTSSGVYDY